MPRPRLLRRYPQTIWRIFEQALEEGYVVVPFKDYRRAYNCRSRLYQFRRDAAAQVRAEDNPSLADFTRQIHELSLAIKPDDNNPPNWNLYIRTPEFVDPDAEALNKVVDHD